MSDLYILKEQTQAQSFYKQLHLFVCTLRCVLHSVCVGHRRGEGMWVPGLNTGV